MLLLTVISGPDRGRCFRLTESGNHVIGRDDCAVRLSDSSISRRHADISFRDGLFMIRDLASSNGTRIGGVKISEPAAIHDSTTFMVGKTSIAAAIISETESGVSAADQLAIQATLEQLSSTVAALEQRVRSAEQAAPAATPIPENLDERFDEMSRRVDERLNTEKSSAEELVARLQRIEDTLSQNDQRVRTVEQRVESGLARAAAAATSARAAAGAPVVRDVEPEPEYSQSPQDGPEIEIDAEQVAAHNPFEDAAESVEEAVAQVDGQESVEESPAAGNGSELDAILQDISEERGQEASSTSATVAPSEDGYGEFAAFGQTEVNKDDATHTFRDANEGQDEIDELLDGSDGLGDVELEGPALAIPDERVDSDEDMPIESTSEEAETASRPTVATIAPVAKPGALRNRSTEEQARHDELAKNAAKSKPPPQGDPMTNVIAVLAVLAGAALVVAGFTGWL